jgi:uncharacterized protein YutE (UPF0331/DUF86 family)
VPLRAEVVRRKLLEIEQAVEQLRAWLPVTADAMRQDRKLQWAIQHGLLIAAEALFDVGAHILAGEFREVTDEYREIPERLHALHVIAADTLRRLDSLAGYRNILVREYAEIDLGRVALALGRLGDFEAFVTDVEGWLTRGGR